MARNTQEFETVVRLNAQQAKDELKTCLLYTSDAADDSTEV